MSGSSIKNYIPLQNKYDRVVLLIDMDCFYCQVEEKLNPELQGKPIAVVQYNAWRGGGIIAVNYPARAQGVTRHMRGDEAKQQCPDIQLVQVPNVREKADLTKYREAGKEVANVLQKFTQLLERASVDEAYLDITEAVDKRLEELNKGLYVLQPERLCSTYAVGFPNIGDYVNHITAQFSNPNHDFNEVNLIDSDARFRKALIQSDVKMLIGASVANEIRAAVKEKTGYECSAGVAHNKIMAKLACGINKPNKQTIMPLSKIPEYFETLPVRKIKGLGAKFGEDVCERLKINFLGSMLKFTESELQKIFDEKNGSWLYQICRGVDLEAVTPRFYSKSIGCCKKFPGLNHITGIKTLNHWLNELATEICDRLEKDIIENSRKARQMVVSFVQDYTGKEIHSSRSCQLTSYDKDSVAAQCLEVIKTNTKQFYRNGGESILNNPIKFLGISVGKFETLRNTQNKLDAMFKNQKKIAEKPTATVTSGEEGQSTSREVNETNKSPEAETEANIEVNQTKTEKKSFLMNYLNKNKIPINESSEGNGTDQPVEQCPQSEKSPEKPKSRLVEMFKKQNEQSPKFSNPKKVTQNEGIESPNIETNDVDEEMPSTSSKMQNKPASTAPASSIKRKFNEMENETTDYRSTYAEYAMPVLNSGILDVIKCDTCGAKIPNTAAEIQTHQDHHLAQQIYQQQSEEYRNEIKSKIAANKTLNQTIQPNKKTKTSSTSKNSSIIKADITQFLKPQPVASRQLNETSSADTIEFSLDTASIQDDPDTFLCTECNKTIPKIEEAEHKDFHLAQQLQREFNQIEPRPMVPVSNANPTTNQAKNSVKSGGKQKNVPSIKPITKFFTKN